jgi:hypothetical protein
MEVTCHQISRSQDFQGVFGGKLREDGKLGCAVGAWIVLLDDTPFEGRVLGKLANPCKMHGVWEELVEKYPANSYLAELYSAERNVNVETNKALISAVENDDLDQVRMLLHSGGDANAQGGYLGNALQAASWTGSEMVVRLLLDNGADINSCGAYEYALQAASVTGKGTIIRLLLDKGADANAQGGCFGTALQVASRRGNVEILRLLREYGAH